MEKQSYSIRDVSLSPSGLDKIEWVRRNMALLNGIEEKFREEQPFKGLRIALSVHLEAKTAKNKDLYYDALGASQDGWHEGTDDPVPFIKYLLSTILAAYRDFEDRFSLVEMKIIIQ